MLNNTKYVRTTIPLADIPILLWFVARKSEKADYTLQTQVCSGITPSKGTYQNKVTSFYERWGVMV